MVLTGRAGLVALVGALAVALAPAPGAVLLILLTLLLVALLVDVSLAASVRRLSLSRTGVASGRQGEPTPVVLTVTNDGKRRLRGALRDAWPPSAGATPRAHRVDIPAGERRRFETVLVPTRR